MLSQGTPALKFLFNRQNILAVAIFVFHIVHALLDHKNSKSADLTPFRGKRGIRIILRKRIIRNTRVSERNPD